MFIYIIRAVAVVVGVAVVAVIVITAPGGNTWQFLCFHSLNVVRVHHHANVVNDTIHPPLSHSNAAQNITTANKQQTNIPPKTKTK